MPSTANRFDPLLGKLRKRDTSISDKTYSQSFNVTTTVVVTHNLGKKPAVTIIDSANDECEGMVVHDSNNQCTVTFSAAFSGIIICN